MAQLASADFALFQSVIWIQARYIISRYPQSNGKAEKAVQVIKSLFKKAKAGRHDPYIGLLELPKHTSGKPPISSAKCSWGVGLRTQLPTAQTLLTPQCMTGVHRTTQKQSAQNKTVL